MRSNVFKCGFSKVLLQHAFGEHFFQPTVPRASQKTSLKNAWISMDSMGFPQLYPPTPAWPSSRNNQPSWWRPYSHRKFHPSWPCAERDFQLEHPTDLEKDKEHLCGKTPLEYLQYTYTIHYTYIYIYYNYIISYISSIIILAWHSFASKKKQKKHGACASLHAVRTSARASEAAEASPRWRWFLLKNMKW